MDIPTPPAARPTLGKLTDDERRAAARPKGWLRFSPIHIQKTNLGTRVRVNWKTTVLAGLTLLLFGWTGGAGAAYLFVKYSRGFPEVKYSQMLFYPTQREAHQIARGDFLVDQAKKQLKEGNYREAFYNFRTGVSLSPSNREGRLFTAEFYALWQRPDLAQTLLIEGLTYHREDLEYVQALFSFLLQRQEDFDVIRLAKELISEAGPVAELNDRVQVVATAHALALFFRGNFDASEDTLARYGLNQTVEGKLLGVRMEWERGDTEAALVRLQQLTEEYPDNEQVYAQYAVYLRESGRVDELRRLSLMRQLSYPERARPRIDLLYTYDQAGNQAHLDTGISEIFRDFSSDAEVMFALADFATNAGRPQLARRIYEHCKANNLPWEGPALMTVEAYVVAKEYRAALAACAELEKENPEWAERFASAFDGIQAIAAYGLKDGEAADAFLSKFLDQVGIRSENYVAVANRLINLGAMEPARKVLTRAVNVDSLNQAALTGLIHLDLKSGQVDALSIRLRALMAMRKPPRKLLSKAHDNLASDLFLLTPGRGALLDELRKAIDGNAQLMAAKPGV
ncbi:MAG: hypothetical protein EAZ36_01325 [Verrucomicrobia bacterium]|nr:MAG: hypothetical protein EAZ36_01325 [Verrucomicrobiota bacterium]